MRVILNREEKEEEPAPPSLPHSSNSTAGAPAASAGVADVVSSSNALSVSTSPPLSSREGVQNSPCVTGTGTSRNSGATTADGQQLRRTGGHQPFSMTRAVAASSCVPAQEASRNGKQRAPNSFGDDQGRANSDDELDDDVNRGGMDRRTKPPSSAGESGSAEEVVVSSSSSSREGNACLIT